MASNAGRAAPPTARELASVVDIKAVIDKRSISAFQ